MAINHNDTLALNNKAVVAIDKYLSGAPSLTLAGETISLAALKTRFSAEAEALQRVDEARLRYRQEVSAAKAKKNDAAAARKALKGYLLGVFGPGAVEMLGEFGFDAPKVKPARAALVSAEAVKKAKATRVARHTMGKRQRLAIKGAPAAPSSSVPPPANGQ